MKKILPIIIVIIVILTAIGGFLIWRGKRVTQEATTEPEQEGVLIETALEERPYVTLTPRADGREFTLEIARIKNAKKIEYELVYLSQGLSRGVVGTVDLKGESEISRKLLLGTCSRNVCKYDEGVEEGTLTLRFRDPNGVRKFVSDFHLQQGEDRLSSKDGNFTLEGKLSADTFYITMATIGLPQEIKEKMVGGPYGIFASGSKVVKNGAVGLTLSEESTGAKLYSWQGTSWQEETDKFELKDKTLSASVASLATFIAAASSE